MTENTAKPKARPKTQTPEPALAVEEITPEAEPEVQPEAEPTPKPKPKPVAPRVATPNAVVGKGKRDDVLLSRMVFKNPHAHKSLSVHHLQRRLTELGYGEAGADQDGLIGTLTVSAIYKYQTDNKNLNRDGIVDADTLQAIFDGDPNCNVIIDI
jgi:peptidoglycan hydrolase-like protein with peptidoglycan-binding domain